MNSPEPQRNSSCPSATGAERPRDGVSGPDARSRLEAIDAAIWRLRRQDGHLAQMLTSWAGH